MLTVRLLLIRKKQSEGTNVILADEMGLGKTVQVLTYADVC
jgi:SNF2 family DNA or RNA helicase